MQPALTPGQEAAIVALVRSPTYAAAAKAAGVGERTLRRWMHNDANFRQRLREARAGVFDQAVRAMHLASPKAAGVLDGIAQDAAASQTARVSAARTLIHYSCRGHEMADIDGRPAELEARIDAIRTYVARSEQRYERRGAVTPKRASAEKRLKSGQKRPKAAKKGSGDGPLRASVSSRTAIIHGRLSGKFHRGAGDRRHYEPFVSFVEYDHAQVHIHREFLPDRSRRGGGGETAADQ